MNEQLIIINNKIFMEGENKNQINIPAEKSNKKKIITIAIILVAVLGAGSYFMPGNFNIWSKFNILIRGNAVAVINGEKITKSDLDSRIDKMKEIFKLQGANLADEKTLGEIKKQTLNDMINEKILLQNAKKSGFTVSDADVQISFDQLVAKFKTKEDFQKELTLGKLTEKEVKENIANQITLNKYIEQNIDVKNLNATDEEINNLYKKYAAQQKNIPKLEDIKTQLAAEIKQQKSKAMILELIDKLKKDADIKIFL